MQLNPQVGRITAVLNQIKCVRWLKSCDLYLAFMVNRLFFIEEGVKEVLEIQLDFHFYTCKKTFCHCVQHGKRLTIREETFEQK